jgi:RNA polymerase sigma-70 factor (ECF subfamily)
MIPVFILAIEDEERRSKYADAYIQFSQQLIAVASFVLYGKTGSKDGEQTQAEDVVQEAFRHVLEKDNLPADPNKAKALLITITKHIAIDALRKNRHMADEEPTEIQLGYTMPENSSGLSLIVDDLPDKYKEVLILYYEYGYRVKEIAEMLNVSESTVLKRLERARKLVKEQYLNEND